MPKPQFKRISEIENIPVAEIERYWDKTEKEVLSGKIKSGVNPYAIIQMIMKKKYPKWASVVEKEKLKESALGFM